MLRGLTTVSFYADDLEAASRWYAEFFRIEPYFPVPGYVEFRIGDYGDELGIIDRRYAPPCAGAGPGGQIVFWYVDDLAGTVDRLTALGAAEYERSGTGATASSPPPVVDPFDNVLGVMTNPHYLDVLAARST